MPRHESPKTHTWKDGFPLLVSGEVTRCELVPWGSNYTFQVTLRGVDGAECQGIYKPRSGEAPLWDFPPGTLYKREYAAYLVAEALGWRFIPPTCVRQGPHGVGSMQLFVEHERNGHYLTLWDRYPEEFKRICLFDWLANNADRKAGHCLLGLDGRIWAIDHGLTFNAAPKLRTVIWDFSNQPVPPALLQDVRLLAEGLASRGPLVTELEELLLPDEMAALKRRLDHILASPVFPSAPHYHSVPWPPV